VVLPAYRDAPRLARHVPELQRHLAGLGVSHEIVICDDGSGDGGATRAVAEELGCAFVANPRNRGKGAALRRGMRVARGRYRIVTDADVPYELDAIATMLWYLDFKGFHMVAGDRHLEGSRYQHQVPLWRRVGSAVCSFVVGRFVASGWYDTQCGLKGFRAAVADDLFGVSRIDRFAFDVEIVYLALKRNYDVKRIPVRLRCQEGSTVRLLRDGLAVLRDLARMRWYQLRGCYRPRRRVVDPSDSPPAGYFAARASLGGEPEASGVSKASGRSAARSEPEASGVSKR
jgi:dolichyl-phosphate beta-glucosyltransferase